MSVVRKRFNLLSCRAPHAGGSCCGPGALDGVGAVIGGEGVRPPLRVLCGEWSPPVGNGENMLNNDVMPQELMTSARTPDHRMSQTDPLHD